MNNWWDSKANMVKIGNSLVRRDVLDNNYKITDFYNLRCKSCKMVVNFLDSNKVCDLCNSIRGEVL